MSIKDIVINVKPFQEHRWSLRPLYSGGFSKKEREREKKRERGKEREVVLGGFWMAGVVSYPEAFMLGVMCLSGFYGKTGRDSKKCKENKQEVWAYGCVHMCV